MLRHGFAGRVLAPAAGGLALLVSAASFAAPPVANLEASSSAELQKLLQVQAKQTKVVFANRQPPRAPSSTFDRLFMWNEIALDTTAIDHTPLAAGEKRVFGEQFGPHRSSRAMAIIHIAMFDAVNAIVPKFHSYANVQQVTGDVSIDSAIAQAAHDTLVWLYPSQAPRLDELFAVDLSRMPRDPAGVTAGEALGKAAAQAIIALRSADGSQYTEPTAGGPFTLIGGVGHWSPDPVSQLQVYLGAYWPGVTPFVLASASQFRAPPPPALTDPAYTRAFKQAQRLGGDPLNGTKTDRTKKQTIEGVFWSYDGTPALCAPPRLYNQIARTIALQQGMRSVPEAARFLALINTAMADAGIAAWDTKWYYQYWRPVTAIRSPDQGGNNTVEPDPAWYPLGAAATNTHGPNFTPPFPAYVSGHATFGGALFEILRKYYPDATPFTFTSDEWNGLNTDIYGKIMPLRPLSFPSLSAAEYANSESRIYLGVHWQFDSDVGIVEGNHVGDWVFDHAFRPLKQAPARPVGGIAGH